jgi:hypothetical protein
MDDALPILEYLQLLFKTESAQEYIAFLWDAFDTNYTNSNTSLPFLPNTCSQ